jgi:hypothetical protein
MQLRTKPPVRSTVRFLEDALGPPNQRFGRSVPHSGYNAKGHRPYSRRASRLVTGASLARMTERRAYRLAREAGDHSVVSISQSAHSAYPCARPMCTVDMSKSHIVSGFTIAPAF